MRTGQRGERALLGAGIVEVDAEREHAEARVRPRWDVLMPVHRVTASRPLEVQLRAVETHVRAEHVRDEIDHGRILRERPQLGMLIHGLAQPPDIRLFGAVIRSEIELVVGRAERALFFDLGGDDSTQPIEPRAADLTGYGEKTVREVALALALGEATNATSVLSIGAKPSLAVSTRWSTWIAISERMLTPNPAATAAWMPARLELV